MPSDGGEKGERQQALGGRVLCLLHSLASKETGPDLPAPFLAVTSWSTLDIRVFLPVLPETIRLLL